jgi:hypothetical protein
MVLVLPLVVCVVLVAYVLLVQMQQEVMVVCVAEVVRV